MTIVWRQVYYTIDKPEDGWTGLTGHVDKTMLAKTMPPPTEGSDTLIFVCGPPGMYKAVSGPKGPKGVQGELEGLLKDMKYEAGQVFKL